MLAAYLGARPCQCRMAGTAMQLRDPQACLLCWMLQGYRVYDMPEADCLNAAFQDRRLQGAWLQGVNAGGHTSAPAWVPLHPDPALWAPKLQDSLQGLQGLQLDEALDKYGLLGPVSCCPLLNASGSDRSPTCFGGKLTACTWLTAVQGQGSRYDVSNSP